MLEERASGMSRHCMDCDILERDEEVKKLNRHFTSIPWPNDKYLRRICNERDKTKNETDDKTSKERMHGLPALRRSASHWEIQQPPKRIEPNTRN